MSTETKASPLSNLPVGSGVPSGPSTGTRTPVGPDGNPVPPVMPKAQAPDVPDKNAPAPTIEELMAAVEKAESLKADASLAGGHEGVDWEKTLSSLPEDARKLLGNLRADYSRKTQAVAEQARRLESERKALTNSEAYRKLEELSKKEVGEFDPYNPDSFLERIRKEVAVQMMESLKPVVQKQQEEEARASVQAFITEHPEIQTDRTLKMEIAKELKADENLTLEKAYWIVKGRQETARSARLGEELSAYRKAAQAAGLRVAAGTRPGELRPPSSVKGAVAIMNWLRSQERS